MVSPALLILHLVIAIAIILVCIIVLKLNASIGMVLACLYMGVMGGLGLMDTVSTISSGFGSMMTSIGLPIGFGVILGQLLNDSGAAGVIADKIVSAFPEKRAMWAISLAGFVLSIPVFFDVTFVILIPIGITIAAKINKKMCYVTGCLTIGATTAHCVVPPTPNPLAAADIFGFDLGIMMGVGLVVGLITVLISDFVFIKIHDRGIWNEDKDVNHSSNVVTELLESAKRDADAKRPRPSFAMSLLPIIIPIVCILAGTVGNALFEESPVICQFLGEKVIAMLLGTLGAYLVSIKYIGRANFEKSAGEALKSAGVVLLITGAGGSFSSVIAATGIGDSIVSLLSTGTNSVVPAMFLCYLIGMIFRVAQGSGTVAGMTSMTIMATVAPAIGCHPVWLALACLSGGNSIGHVNDSGFWVATNMSGLTVTGGLKTYTLGSFISSVCIFLLALIGALVIPL
ncbi:MAG: GntP family permease [Dysosmobacter sp.]|nr:GntP family permease [Dysosmobacter sp.]